MADSEKKKNVSKKHLARVERERIQQRYITIITIVVISVAILLTVGGFILEGVIKPNKPIAQVNDVTITTREFQSRARYSRYLLITEFLNTYQYIQSFGDPTALSYFETYLLQIQSQLEPGYLGLDVIDRLIEDELIRVEAENLGIRVDPAEVEDKVDGLLFGYFPQGTPTAVPTTIPWVTPTLSALQQVLVPPTPTPTEVVTPTEEIEPTPTVEIEPTPTAMVVEPTAIPPTPTQYTEKAYKTNYKDFMSYIRNYARVSEDDIFAYYQAQLLRQKVSEAIITDISPDEEVLWARHILFQDEETGEQQAKDFLARIDNGEDFVTVAQELSTPPSDSTEELQIKYEDLGWFGEGDMVKAFEDAAKTLEIGGISQPVKTSFGWHVIQLLGRDTRARDQLTIDQLRSNAFQEWLAARREEAQVDINPDWLSAVPTSPDIPEQLKITLEE